MTESICDELLELSKDRSVEAMLRCSFVPSGTRVDQGTAHEFFGDAFSFPEMKRLLQGPAGSSCFASSV